jgi:hypothetical protein
LCCVVSDGLAVVRGANDSSSGRFNSYDKTFAAGPTCSAEPVTENIIGDSDKMIDAGKGNEMWVLRPAEPRRG